jgi:hypothetical protein
MENIKKMKEKYYIKIEPEKIKYPEDTKNKNNLHEKINLFFSIENCQDNTEYAICIEEFAKKNQINENLESYRTNVSENNENNVEKFYEKKLNKSSSILEFDNFYQAEFFFEREQPISIKININDKLYPLKSSINSVATARKGIYKKDINKGKINEKLIIKSFKNNDYIYINFNVKSSNNLNFGLIENKIYYKVYGKKLLYSSAVINDDGKFDVSNIPILYF